MSTLAPIEQFSTPDTIRTRGHYVWLPNEGFSRA